MRIIKFANDYGTLTANKEYPILDKSYTDFIFEYLFFIDDIGEEIELKQQFNAPPSDMFEVIFCEG